MMPDVLTASSEHNIRLLVDSGAFTAWKAGTTIDLDDYCRFLDKELTIAPFRYFTLDVIGDAQKTLSNYDTMLRRGFSPVPIFTRGEDVSVLEHYYASSDLVGIGGLVRTPNNKGFVKAIMRRVAGRHCHWLGFVDLAFIATYKPYSCDASTWTVPAIRGILRLYLEKGKFVDMQRKDLINRPPTTIERKLAELGFTLPSLRKEDAWTGSECAIRRIGAASHARFSVDMEQQFGTIYFLATGAADQLRLVLAGFRSANGTR